MIEHLIAVSLQQLGRLEEAFAAGLANHEVAGNSDEAFSENISAYHESLFENYQSLESTLSELRSDLKHFVTTIQ